MDALAHVPWDFVLLILELHLFEDTETDWVDEDKTAINARGVDNKHLLITLLQTQEPGLGVVERMFIGTADIILALFSAADYYALLGEVTLLLDIPNFEDPVRVQSIETARLLVNYKVDDIVVLERGPGAQVYYLQG